MVDSNFANPFPARRNAPQPRLTQGDSTLSPTFGPFCRGTVLGLVIGALCGAYLPDRVLSAGPFSSGIPPIHPTSSAPRLDAEATSTTPAQRSLLEADALSGVEHTWDSE